MGVELIDYMGTELRIVEAAQVSTKGAFNAPTKTPGIKAWWKRITHQGGWSLSKGTRPNPGLVKWLYRERHASPFEHCVMTFRIEAPIFITREILRHRISSFNEESGRYKVLKGVFYAPASWRKIKQVGKVGNYEFVAGSGRQKLLVRVATRLSPKLSWLSYQLMITAGVSREIARIVLPVSTYSSLYYTANLRSILNFLSLRVDWGEKAAVRSHPQAEIEDVARQMAEQVKKHYPNVWESFVANGYQSV